MFHMKYLFTKYHLLVLLYMVTLNSGFIFSKQCFGLYASIVGGGLNSTGNTVFNMIFPLSQGSYIIIGQSSSTNVLDIHGATGRPFIIKYNPQLQIQYARYMYKANSQKIYKSSWGSLSRNSEYLFLTTEWNYAPMLLHRVSDGELLGNFMISQHDNQIYTQYKFIRAEMESLDKTYLLAFDEWNYQQLIICLDLSGINNGALSYPIIPQLIIQSQGDYEWFQIMYLSSDTRFLYFYGQQSMSQAVFKMDTLNNLQSQSNFAINPPNPNYKTAGIILYSSIEEDHINNIQWQFLCSYNVNYDPATGFGDVNFWLLKETNKHLPDSYFSYEKNYFISYPNQYLTCSGAYLDSNFTKFAGALYSYYAPYFALVIAFDINDSGIIQKSLPNFYSPSSGDQLQINHIDFTSASTAKITGILNRMQGVTYPYYQGVTIDYPPPYYVEQDSLITITIQVDGGNQTNMKQNITIDPLQTFDRNLIPSNISNQSYTIGSVMLIISFDEFQFSVKDCEDLDIVYSLYILTHQIK
eukprot:403350266